MARSQIPTERSILQEVTKQQKRKRTKQSTNEINQTDLTKKIQSG